MSITELQLPIQGVVPLQVRSGYSLLRGLGAPGDVVRRASELGHAQLALTDVNGLYGATVFHREAVAAGVRPIIGAELLTAHDSAVALVENQAGYENLCRLITAIHCCPANPELPASDDLATLLPKHSDGLHVIVEDAALVERLLAGGFPRERIWLGIDPATQRYSRIWRLQDCAERFDLPLTATGKALLSEADEIDAARLLVAIRLGTTFAEVPDSLLPHTRAVLRSGATLAAQLAEFSQAAQNNRRLAERCEFALLPRRPVFPSFPCPDGISANEHLRRLCDKGLRRRYDRVPRGARERLKRELDLIQRMGFSEYFLVVWDIVQYARSRRAPVAGRGSGASSLAAYLLGITNVCPLACDIPFERFLHERREDFPDLDVDFCWRIRDDVIDYAFRRWGRENAAMVSTHGTFQPASAMRETAKAFGFSNEQISRMGERLSDALEERDDASAPPSRLDRVTSLARRILHLPHVLSVHPGGIVITPRPIDRYVPVQPSAKGVRITQYDKDGIEDIRLVKLDLLGNRNLSTVRYACDLVRRRHGVEIDIESIPPDDPEAFELIRHGRTVGCNQLESPAMRHLLVMMQPREMRDVMKALALIRPGAASIGMKETFIRRRRGFEPVPPAPPQMRGVLDETSGVMLYEDDVMFVAAALMGRTLAEADRFRKAVQKCRSDEDRLAISREFLSACRASGVDDAFARDLWVQMAKFNAYSFCRAHAASYAALACAGAYLRAHWPVEFWTAALNNNQSMYHPRVYVEQAKRCGIRFLLPDVNRSEAQFAIEGGSDLRAGPRGMQALDSRCQGQVRTGLGVVDSLGPAGVEAILSERADRPFESLSDFLSRTRLGRAEARALILCGAFDSLGASRPGLMMELNLFLTLSRQAFSGGGLLGARVTLGYCGEDYDEAKKRRDERSILGISVGEHVMAAYRPGLDGAVDADSRDLPRRVGRRVRIAGMLEARRATSTRNDRPITFLTLDDEFGLFEATLFGGADRRTNANLSGYGPYVVTGRVEEQYGTIALTAENVRKIALLAQTVPHTREAR